VLRCRSEVDDADALVAGIVAVLDELGQGPGPGLPVGLGMAGLVDREGRLRYGPNVGVREVPLAQRCCAPRWVEDGWSRSSTTRRPRSSASTGSVPHADIDDVVMLTLGTGVGGGVIVDGRLVEGAHGFAGELGHLVIAEDGRDAPSGVRGTVEAYVSGTAIAREADEAVAAGLAGARSRTLPVVIGRGDAG
jgi:glucokinase